MAELLNVDESDIQICIDEGRLFCLPMDAESFRSVKERGQIEIAMDGLYAAAVREAADEVIKMAGDFKPTKVSIT